MQLCEEVADGLAGRGHDIAVLTSSTLPAPELYRPYPVYRSLKIDPDWESKWPGYLRFFIGRRSRERNAIAALQRLWSQFKPQIIFVWHAVGLPKALLQEAENLQETQVVYYLADYQAEIGDEYIEYWSGNPANSLIRVLKSPLRMVALAILKAEGKPIKLKYEHVICVSHYVRDRLIRGGHISPESLVIHNGIDLTCFSPANRRKSPGPDSRLRCLVAGRIIPHKGVHTVIEAFDHLRRQFSLEDVTLTILGDGPKDYLARLQEMIVHFGLQQMITFRGPVLRSQMPEVFSEHDVLILASEYEEPLARAIQEAMAMELLVIGTTTGGSSELLIHDQTGLTFSAGDSLELAKQIARAITQPDLIAHLVKAGRKAVEDGFDIRKTVSKIEHYLRDLAE